MSYFITGTDTGVGKTLISVALLHAFAAQGKSVAGFKPVAAGRDSDQQNDDAKSLRAASSLPLDYAQVNPYCFPDAVAPHLAARLVGEQINLPRLLAAYRELVLKVDVVIVEGVGGFCVPLNETQTSIDLARALNLPIILVVGMRLGCLNHALLTVRAIIESGMQCAGWVANEVQAEMPYLQENIQALCERIDAPLLGVVPFQAEPDTQQITKYLAMENLHV